jgi:hypothetical protein
MSMLGSLLNIFGKRSREEDNSTVATQSAAENASNLQQCEASACEENNGAINEEPDISAGGDRSTEAMQNAGGNVFILTECETSASEENNGAMNEVPDISAGETDTAISTLAQLLTKTVPDADIHGSDVIIVGGQSSGKTKMIISMVFHHLVNNPAVTDGMGGKLLELFRTGEKMVTRRPTQICFVKTPCGSPCQISLNLAGESANFGEPMFDEIVNRVYGEGLEAFEEELRVEIAAPELPNMCFTDLPGLVTEDREVSDAEGLTIRELVKRYMRRPQTTLVVVEPAATEDFDTSQVAPLLR